MTAGTVTTESESPEEQQRFYDHKFSFASPIDLRKDGKTALLVVDMQYHDASPNRGWNLAVERLQPGSLDYYNRRVEDQVIPTIRELLTYFRANRMPVVYVTLGSDDPQYRDMPRRSREMLLRLEERSGVSGIFWSGDPAFAIRREIEPVPGETIVRKLTAGAFNSSDIEVQLHSLGIQELVVTGVTTSCCVESTARDAVDRGFGCVLVDSGTAEYDAEAHDATLRTFHGNFGRVVASASDIIHAIESETAI